MDYGIETLTPEEAQRRRTKAMEEHREMLRLRREQGRGARKWQTASGLRPKRGECRRGTVRFISANINCARRWQEEIAHGT